ncbi:hypothetical protein DL93DRAFT_2096032 [Clavulina sp. PMI_390]|nr:hypothetical protein DL93DRAFT_2096032 [Clavulina sp. PMI_390]
MARARLGEPGDQIWTRMLENCGGTADVGIDRGSQIGSAGRGWIRHATKIIRESLRDRFPGKCPHNMGVEKERHQKPRWNEARVHDKEVVRTGEVPSPIAMRDIESGRHFSRAGFHVVTTLSGEAPRKRKNENALAGKRMRTSPRGRRDVGWGMDWRRCWREGLVGTTQLAGSGKSDS